MLGLDLKTIAQATDLSINLVRQQVTADRVHPSFSRSKSLLEKDFKKCAIANCR